ncbi:unnamed protein product [Amoebophrya sp. A25]|nr:unnamed protein product [Amoebophrya sp. A25]|eukprot:GSA25T00021076001.1
MLCDCPGDGRRTCGGFSISPSSITDFLDAVKALLATSQESRPSWVVIKQKPPRHVRANNGLGVGQLSASTLTTNQRTRTKARNSHAACGRDSGSRSTSCSVGGRRPQRSSRRFFLQDLVLKTPTTRSSFTDLLWGELLLNRPEEADDTRRETVVDCCVSGIRGVCMSSTPFWVFFAFDHSLIVLKRM